MASGFWEQVVADGLQVPTDRPLGELTAELTTMLGSTDPALREGCALELLSTWLDRGVYDDLLVGLGDGMTAGLDVGLGESGTDTVFRRSFSALLLGRCIARDNVRQLLPVSRVLTWGDRLAAWYVREQDLRGFVPGKGWAHAAAHGADALGALARSPGLAAPELTVLLDVIADRLLLPAPGVMVAGEPDRMAAATVEILRRDVVPLRVLEPWVSRLALGADREHASGAANPFERTHDVEGYLRALYLRLSIGQPSADRPHPAVRPDLLLVLVDALRATNPDLRGGR
ncbi:DUF2785 domain-containing protein [Nocardioides donggukensis]|uniref:DUF2785 domain-containing protein n=1 Tax=Nocardioides donggukensis TaxID=2774019 RepID=A0A927Q305_9ACTN|nr:DUF2785 domain-containing protein [Nocardioides donggukensis]MBD8870136.1 DUF2785 domain-containing protein [Nocardioides donggukensis]